MSRATAAVGGLAPRSSARPAAASLSTTMYWPSIRWPRVRRSSPAWAGAAKATAVATATRVSVERAWHFMWSDPKLEEVGRGRRAPAPTARTGLPLLAAGHLPGDQDPE